MSHFTVMVVLPNTAERTRLEHRLAEILAPYDEGRRVDPYEQGCYCVGKAAWRRAIKVADAECGTLDDLRKGFYAQPENRELDRVAMQATGAAFRRHEAELNRRWSEHTARHKATVDAALEADPEKKSPAAECDECHGTGKVMSTYNPQSKWDWYAVGGRWAGAVIPGDMAPVERVREIVKDDDHLPFALLDAEGWHEKGRMGWFATVADERPEEAWGTEVRERLAKAPADALVVLIDCHI